MSAEQRFREAASGLRTDRVTERRRTAESLRNLLDAENITKQINASTWKAVFIDVHDYVLKEFEKYDPTKSASSNAMATCSHLLHKTLAVSSKHKNYIDCNKILDCSFEILNCSRYFNVIGSIYITVLNKHILPISYQLERITPHQWADLLSTIVRQCRHDAIDHLEISHLLLLILREGILRCHLILPVRDNLNFFEILFTSTNNEKKHHLQENYLQIAILIVENVGVESRLAVCRFTETIIPHAMKYYEQTNVTQKNNKKVFLFKFLRLCIVLHHPKGRTKNETGSFASDWESWNQLLLSMYQLVVSESMVINQHYEKNGKSQLLSINDEFLCEFINFASEICHQIFKGQIDQNDVDGETSSTYAKRTKLDYHNFFSFSQVTENLTKTFHPWISILSNYIKKFGKFLCHEEKYKALTSMFDLSKSEEKTLQHHSIFECIIGIYENVEISEWNEKYTDLSTLIWNMAIRKTSTQNKIFEYCHRIIQLFLKYDHFQPSLNSLIKSYFDRNMPCSDICLETLIILFRKYNTKINDENVRLQIAKWVLENYKLLDQINVCTVLFQLCTKERLCDDLKCSLKSTEDYIFHNIFESMENFMLIADFELNLLYSDDCKDIKKTDNNSFTIYPKVFTYILETSVSNLSKTITDIKEFDTFVPNVLVDINNLFKFLSFVSIYIPNEYVNIFDNYKIHLYESFDIINNRIPIYLNSLSDNDNNKLETLKSLGKLYKNGYHCKELSSLIRDYTNQEIIEILISLGNKKENHSQTDDYDFMEINSEIFPSSNYKLKFSTIDIICNYCCENAKYRNASLELILEPDFYDFTLKSDIDLAVKVISFILENFKEDIPLSALSNLLQNICKYSYRDNEDAFKILSLLFDILKPISVYGNENNKNNCIIMLKSFLIRCKTHYYSIKVMGQALKCLSWILNSSNLPGWGRDLENTFTECLCSSIFSIRMYSCYCLSLYIAKVKPENYETLAAELQNVFNIDDVSELTTYVTSDEGANRTATILYCLSHVSLSSSVWDHLSIATILKIGYIKSIDIKLTTKVINIINKLLNFENNIILENIGFFINFWIKNDLPIEKFPYTLTDCSSIDDFYLKFKHTLIAQEAFLISDVNARSVMLTLNEDTLNGKIISECIPDLIILCLLDINYEHFNDSLDLKTVLRQKLKVDVDRLQQSCFEEVFVSSIDKVLYGLVKGVYDVNQMKMFFSWNKHLPYVPDPYVSVKKFDKVLNYFMKCLPVSLSEKIYIENPSILQNLLLQIWASIESQRTLERKLLSLYHYWIFCKILDLTSDLNTFICNFVIRSLLAIIDKYKNVEKFNFISVATCQVLSDLLGNMLPSMSNIIVSLIPSIVSTICQLVQENALGKKCGLKILSLIFLEKRQCFENLFDTLDPLPKIEIFAKINDEIEQISINEDQKLEKYIEKFLSGNIEFRSEGLKLLYNKLFNHRGELIKMVDNLNQIRGFSEDCSNSKLHKLIAFLFKISSNTNSENESLLASKCLGKIGSCDLQTLVIQTPVNSDNIAKDPKFCFTHTFFSEIHNLIFDSNPSVIRASTKALIRLFSFKDGSAILGHFDADMKLMMIPFLSKKKSLPPSNFQVSSTFNAYLNRPEIWYNFDYKEHSDWIIEIMVSALNSFSHQQCFLLDFVDICRLKYCVAEKCFPSLIGLLLSISNREQVATINLFIQKYFDRYYNTTFVSDEDAEYSIKINRSETTKCFSKASVKCMLNLVQFIRMQMKNYDWDEELLSFNYLPIAWAAFHTGSYFTSILYGELWCNDLQDNVPPINPDAILSYDNSQNMLSIMRKSYRMIGDLDALQGCGLGHFSNIEGRRKHHIFSGHFSDAFLLHDLLLSPKIDTTNINLNSIGSLNDSDSDKTALSNFSSAKSFAQCLHASGLYHLSDKYMQSYGDNSYFDEIKYDCAWRLGDWSLHVDSSSFNSSANSNTVDNENIWHAYHYMCLKNALDESASRNTILSNCLKQARFYINSSCELSTAFDNCKIIYESMGKQQLLQEIEDFKIVFHENQNNLINHWSLENLVSFSNFKNVEPILSQRLIILNDLLKKSGDIQLKASVVEMHLDYADLALRSDSIQTCNRWINMASHTLRTLVNSQNNQAQSCLLKLVELTSLAEGKAAWKSGHIDIAFHLIKTIISKKSINDRNVYARSLITYGSWMVETRRESAQDILNNYLMESLNTVGEDGESSTKLEAFLIIAKFADGEYKQIDSYMKSPAYTNKIKCMERCKDTVEILKERHDMDLTKTERKAKMLKERQNQIDEIEISNTEFEKAQYLQLALKYYLRALTEGNEDDFPAFRVISLWLDNASVELDTDDDKCLLDYFKLIPSRKFLTLLPQLAPRLNHIIKNNFQDTLYELIKKCAIEHPHHTLPILLALKHSNKDSEYQNAKDKNSSNEFYSETAKKMLNQLNSCNIKNLKSIITEMDRLYTSLISLANYKAKQSNTNKYKIPRSETIMSLKNLSNVVVPTINLPVSKTGDYRNIINIISFSNEFMLVGGINAPKKMSCLGSDGIQRNILLKGEDDIRQDAVMQQVFGIVNKLLANDIHTRKSRLQIRTYRVVPLSRHSGIIEWCDGTETFGRLLTGANGTGGYHAGLRPNDMQPKTARLLMTEKMKSTNDEKLKTFKVILSKLKPVFHHFFILNFLTPAIWYERRLAYMRSVATSSMIGYILGLGDRHVQNILIDTSTAEVIHIDFGIAFEQGKLQPTPETVPFRLTQDMVAGFGCTGMEGVFRRSCEKMMDLLKSNQEMLLTILEVLLYDPLYIWTISEEQACKNQNILTSSLMTPSTSTPSSTPNNYNEGSGSEAERALIRVRNKLEGTEFGSILATAGQVARLLQQATDPKNLSRLFHGWQPYL